MGRPYSQDLRDRVIAAVEGGQSRTAVAKHFDLSVSCVVKWLQRYHHEGNTKPRKFGGYRPFALAGHRVFVLGRMAEKPDLTISALTEELAARGIRVSRYAVWHFLQHERLSLKKTLHAAEQDRPDVARRRARWKRLRRKLDADRLVFIDDTWTKTNMTRSHGRSLKGTRLVARRLACARR